MSKNFLTPIVLPAGTASSAPLSLQSGTNMVTPAAGAFEYDGKVIYTTPNSTAGRGVSPSMLYYRLNSDLAGSNGTSAQKILGVGATLNASTVYAFQLIFTLAKTTGTASHSISIGFDGGTATFNNVHIHGIYQILQAVPSTNNNLTTGAYFYGVHTTTAQLTYITGIAGAVRTQTGMFSGTVSINASGTFTPQYQLSSAPGGAYSTLAGSSFAIWPIGTAGANT